MNEFRDVSILMGAVTETDSLRETVLTVLKLCDHADLREIIICYSQHATPECLAVISELESMDCDVPIVGLRQKRPGLSGFMDMFEIARGSHCIFGASDLALDLTCTPVMIEYAKQDPECIVTISRWLKGCRFYHYGAIKKIMNYCGQIFLRLLYSVDLTDMTTPYQIVPTELYRSIAFEHEDFPFMLEMVLKPLRLGYRFLEIPSNCYGRKEGKSSNSFRQTAGFLPVAIHIRFMKKEKILKPDSALYARFFGVSATSSEKDVMKE